MQCGSRWVSAVMMWAAATAWAGGPRFVTGSRFAAAQPGVVMAFRTAQPMYFTDPGDLSQGVTHAQADAMVAAAAAVWNVPASALVLAQGGVLAEHVSNGNTYFNGDSVVFPADVSATNYLAKPIAVVYDEDGSVTDLLLGQGASSPSSCRQNAVTESVDAFGPTATIDHAVLVLNGRCVGTSAQQMLQMQYMVMRGFGRVLGLAWSQLNDNVFTGSPAATSQQMAHWPVMHPIDVTCGAYSYQCMVNPFSLRDDDVSGLAMLYPVTAANLTAGKVISADKAVQEIGFLQFPQGAGMDQVNLVATLEPFAAPVQTWETVSGLTGYVYEQNGGNPVSGEESAAEDVGGYWESTAGQYDLHRIPLDGGMGVFLTTEAINPLYTGMYALGPFERPPVMFSGQAMTVFHWDGVYGVSQDVLTMAGASTGCTAGSGGTKYSAGVADPSGWWTSALCIKSSPAYWNVSLRAGRSWTLEATALDEKGGQTVQKAQLVLGAWNVIDDPNMLPTVAEQAVPMNSSVPGMTQMRVAAATADQALRIVVADEYGDGRPDFAFRTRLLYADNLSATTVTQSGGQMAVNGMGFANGNRVTVKGVTAKVVSWSPTQIVFVAPAMSAVKAQAGVPVDVAVVDLTTAGSTVMSGALTYSGTAVLGMSVQTGTAYVAAGASVSVPVVFVATQDGVGAAGVGVSWSSTLTVSGDAVTGVGGVANALVAGSASGTLQGCAWSTVCATWSLVSVDSSQWVVSVASGAGQSVKASGTLGPVTLRVTDGAGHALIGAPVVVSQTVYAWEGTCAGPGRCPSAPVLASSRGTWVSDASGLVSVAPLQVSGVAETVGMVGAAGVSGFVSLTLVKTP